MERNNVTEQIIAKEWEMFHNVNGEDRTTCQDEYGSFVVMRKAQYDVWDCESLESYLEDLCAAEEKGINLAREKYIRMMKSTDPEGYNAFKAELPDVSEKKAELVKEIWAHMLVQTQRLHEKYPILALGGRPMLASEENGWPSIETYQTSELLTYSEKTLEKFLANVLALEEQGTDMVYKIQENTVSSLGYNSMDEAEVAMAEQFLVAMGGNMGGCIGGACGVGEQF